MARSRVGAQVQTQVRVPVQMKEQVMPTLGWLKIEDRRARWVQVFARLKPGYTVESAQPAIQTLFTQIRTYEMSLEAAKDWSAYSRTEFMKGKLLLANAAIGYSGLKRELRKRRAPRTSRSPV
mgnify:CR=1 FL=1